MLASSRTMALKLSFKSSSSDAPVPSTCTVKSPAATRFVAPMISRSGCTVRPLTIAVMPVEIARLKRKSIRNGKNGMCGGRRLNQPRRITKYAKPLIIQPENSTTKNTKIISSLRKLIRFLLGFFMFSSPLYIPAREL